MNGNTSTRKEGHIISTRKHAWRLKRRGVAGGDDIRYQGPFSYRAFQILGWLCLLLSVAVAIFAMMKNPEAGAGQGMAWRLISGVARMPALLLLIAGISRIMRDRGEYKQQLLTYLGLAGIVAACAGIIYQHTVLAALDRLFVEPEMVLPKLEEAFANFSGSGFLAFNVFIDIFLCILIFFFVNVRPRHIFTGKWVLILRAYAALPVIYALICMWLKYQATSKNIVLPFWCFPILTTRPVTVYGLFLFLAIYIKKKETIFCDHGHTLKECRESLETRRNSLRFGIILAITMAVLAIMDNLLQYGAAQLLFKRMAPADVNALAWGLQAAKNIGFGGDSIAMLILAPFMLLYSFNRVPRWRIISILAPVVAIVLIVLLILGSGNKSTGAYIVDNVIPKISIVRIQEFMAEIEKNLNMIASMLK